MLYLFSLLSLASIAIYEIYLIVRKQGYFCVLFVTLFFHEISKAFSIAYLDAGNYTKELEYVTWNVYAAPWYLLYLIVFFFFFYIFISSAEKLLERKPPRITPAYSKDIRVTLLLVLGGLMIAYLLVDMLISGIPLFSGGSITRFNYWTSYSRLPAAELVSNMLTVVCVGLGMCQATAYLDGKDKKGSFLVIVAVLIIRFLLGYKVSGIVDVIMAFAIGYVFRRFSADTRGHGGNFGKILKYCILLSVVMVFFYITSQIATGSSESVASAFEDLFERQFSLSGHMEWAVFADSSVVSQIFPYSFSELESVLQMKSELDPGVGVYGLMLKYAPAETYYNYLQHGVRYGAGAVAVSLFYNGHLLTLIGLVINAFIASRFYLVFRRLASSNHIFTFGLLYRVFLVFLSYFTATGTLVTFYRLNVALLLGGCLFIWVVENSLIVKAAEGRSSRPISSGTRILSNRQY